MLLAQGPMEAEAETNKRLIQACRDGREEEARLALRAGASPHARERGKSCLQLAGEAGNAEVLDLLFRHGADPNERDAKGTPILVWAAETGNFGLAHELLKNKADPLAVGSGRWTVLHAVCKGDLGLLAERLIKLGCSVSAQDNFGNTPLHVAASFGAVEPAKQLLEWGADINATNVRGLTPLTAARRARRFLMAEFLNSKGAVEFPKIKQLLLEFDDAHPDVLRRVAEDKQASSRTR